MFFRKSITSYLELETISEPSSVDIFLHNPEVLIVHLHRRRRWLPTSRDCVGLCLQQDVDMENIMDSPTRGQLEVVSQIRKLVLDLKGTVPFARKLWRGFISQEIGRFEPHRISDFKARVVVFPLIVCSFRNFLRSFNRVFAFLLCFVNPLDPFIGLARLASTWDIHQCRVVPIVREERGCVDRQVVMIIIGKLRCWK